MKMVKSEELNNCPVLPIILLVSGSPNVFSPSVICGNLRSRGEGKIRVQEWVQLKREEWLRFSCKRHQIGHLDF